MCKYFKMTMNTIDFVLKKLCGHQNFNIIILFRYLPLCVCVYVYVYVRTIVCLCDTNCVRDV